MGTTYINNLINNIMDLYYLHILFPIIISLYGIWAPPFLDPLFVVYFLMLNTSWIVFKNECIISYFYKKQQNPDYKLGDNIDVKDFDDLIGKTNARALSLYISITYFINLFFVLTRLKLEFATKVLVILSYVAYAIYMILLRLRPQWIVRVVHLGLYILTLIVFVMDVYRHG
jgi:hypothetical protein